jgi:para-nitrobenzyl esterase
MLTRRSFLLGSGTAAALAMHPGWLHAFTTGDPVVVRTKAGALRGEELGGVRVFRGVPFARPPIGKMRFRAPEPMEAWQGVRDATSFAAAAAQPGAGFAQGEDCLALNVWAPAAKGSYPVWVWIHGGGFIDGRSFDPMFDGAMFASEGVVIVTVAYRLGVMGFLNAEPLLGAGYANSANNALRDLLAALAWVKENIAEFGGDPERVTIGGQSAGAKLTDILLGVPTAEKLFHQAVSDSGGAERIATREESEQVAEGFAALWQSETGSPAAAIATAPAAQLIHLQQRFMKDWPRHFPLRAMIDGALVPRKPVETIRAGSSAGKRLLLGTAREESAMFIGPHPQHDATAADLGNMTLEAFLPVYEKYKTLYPLMPAELRRIRAITAEEYWVPSMRVAEAHAAAGGRGFVYRLDLAVAAGAAQGLVPHGRDVPLVWNRPHLKTPEELRMARQMHDAWTAFLKHQTPAAAGLPTWPEFTLRERATLLIDQQSHVAERPAEAELKLWEGVL